MLILDDEPIVRELLTVLLESKGYRVTAAESGDAGLRLLEAWAGPLPGVVLTDLQMPGTVGGDLAEKLRAACGRLTLLLAMSASVPRAEALQHFDGFLLKPFSVEHLLTVITEKRRARRKAKREDLEAGCAADLRERSALNEEIYRKLVDVMPQTQLHSLYMLCLDDGRKRAERMLQLISSGDEGEYLREAHALKGGCGMLGATELYDLASDMEKAGLHTGTGGNLVEQIGVAFERLERILDARA